MAKVHLTSGSIQINMPTRGEYGAPIEDDALLDPMSEKLTSMIAASMKALRFEIKRTLEDYYGCTAGIEVEVADEEY